MTIAEEDYLKIILKLELAQGEVKSKVSTNQVSEVMQTKPSSVTDMIKRLQEKSLVDYKKYKGVNLTDQGKKLALKLIRQHRLWETFLVEKLGFSWGAVHEVAEQLEHVHSDELLGRLDEFLEFPTVDPHGEPIPDDQGKLSDLDADLMAKVKGGGNYLLLGIKDPTSALLSFLDKISLRIGSKIYVRGVESYNGSIEIEIGDEIRFITSDIANQLLVKEDEKDNN